MLDKGCHAAVLESLRRPHNKFQCAANDRSREVFSSEWKSNVLRDLPVNGT